MKIFRICLVVVFMTLLINNSGFSYQSKKTLKELVSSAPLVVTGKVTKISSEFEFDTRNDKRIMTFVELYVQDVLKGSCQQPTITIKMLGGTVGNEAAFCDFYFEFSENDQVMLFLSPIEKDLYAIFGISGKLGVIVENGTEFFDCSMLKSDDLSVYGPGSFFMKEDITNRIVNFLRETGGE